MDNKYNKPEEMHPVAALLLGLLILILGIAAFAYMTLHPHLTVYEITVDENGQYHSTTKFVK